MLRWFCSLEESVSENFVHSWISQLPCTLWSDRDRIYIIKPRRQIDKCNWSVICASSMASETILLQSISISLNTEVTSKLRKVQRKHQRHWVQSNSPQSTGFQSITQIGQKWDKVWEDVSAGKPQMKHYASVTLRQLACALFSSTKWRSDFLLQRPAPLQLWKAIFKLGESENIQGNHQKQPEPMIRKPI